MRRSLLVVCLLAASAALTGCGTSEPTGRAPAQTAAEAPAPGDLAADAVAALERLESAHYALDATIHFDAAEDTGSGDPQPIDVHVEGDSSEEAGTADITVDAMGERLAAKLLFGDDRLFVEFLGTWYGDDLAKLGIRRDDPRRELATPPRVREHFEEAFTGTVTEGPLYDGQATWSYTGSLNAEGFLALVERYGETLSQEEREQLESLGHAVELQFAVGKEDDLPRRIQLDLSLDRAVLTNAPLDRVDATLVLELSDFGKEVEVDPPAEYRPLDELGRMLFSGLG